MTTIPQKVALVTGSSRGIGRAIALELANCGYAVVVHGSAESPRLETTLADVRKRQPASISTVAHLADEAAIDAMFTKILATFGRLDALVNNAATQIRDAFPNVKSADWDLIQAVNLRGPFLCGQKAASLMRVNGAGKIVNISSVHAIAPKRNFSPYSIAKGGLETLSKCLALELAASNIQVNSLVVGAIATEMTPEERQGMILSAIPAGRIGRPEEIARTVAFLCSDACEYMTGASLVIDGGLTLGFCASRPDL